MSFQKYIEATKDRKPSQLLIEALTYVRYRGQALDLGAGALHDTRFLLSEGFTVIAVDREPSFALGKEALGAECIVSTFADFSFLTNSNDLINAQWALPFNPRESFDAMFARLIDSLVINGIFTGHLFGPEDAWAHNTNMTFHTEKEVRELLDTFTIHKLEEIKRIGKTKLGQDKFWHYFEIIAEKK